MYRILLALLLLGFSSTAHADIARVVENAASTDSLTNIIVQNTQTVYTKSISLVNHDSGSVGVMYKATSNAGINLSIQAERSYTRPTTEAAADSSYVVWNAPFTTADNTWKMATLDTVVMPYLRFKITGGSGNASTTTVQIKVQKQ